MIFEGLLGALLPVWLPMLAAPLVYLLRRQAGAAALLSSATMAVDGWWLLRFPPTDLSILGRPLALSPLGQALLVALALWLLLSFLFAWRVSQGWSLFPFLLVVFALISAALFFEDLAIQVLLLKLAWLVVILLVQGGAAANTRASARLLILSILALPPFLIAALLLAQQSYQPDSPPLTPVIVLALGMGFALILAVLPFHAWLPQSAEDGPPLVAAWLAGGMMSSYLVVLMDLLVRYPWLTVGSQIARLLFTAGMLLAIGGALLAVTERHLGRLWAYASLADLGYVLLGLSFAGRTGLEAALLVLIGRLVSLLLAGAALATLRHRATSLDFDDLVGVGVRLPLSMLGFALGGLALLGLPLTAGFAGHWAVLNLLAQQGSGWLWPLLAATLLGVVGFLRAFAVLTAPADAELIARVEGEPRVATVLLLSVSVVTVMLGLMPQRLAPLIDQLLRSLAL